MWISGLSFVVTSVSFTVKCWHYLFSLYRNYDALDVEAMVQKAGNLIETEKSLYSSSGLHFFKFVGPNRHMYQTEDASVPADLPHKPFLMYHALVSLFLCVIVQICCQNSYPKLSYALHSLLQYNNSLLVTIVDHLQIFLAGTCGLCFTLTKLKNSYMMLAEQHRS
jgi:hypothetical protein